ncbi:MFS transporter [Psychromonas ossibalaenae]|uniref:MFS transporter n=1 Tax=Psychromonas ossibalaenae TaxID=444922 RepID=UPI000375510D|nr:MFS transporter [Psychromonas ossibalaenae]
MAGLSRTFYLFSGIHSFLLGLLPIFIPVILWDKGLNISAISYFIALTAVGFIIALTFWDRLRALSNWSVIIALSFLFEALLVMLLLWDSQRLLLSVGALLNGAAGCFYWSTQRILFQSITETNNSGDTFGNFQILVVFALKAGILIGSYLLDAVHIKTLLFISLAMSLGGYWLLRRSLENVSELFSSTQPKAFTLTDIMQFKDNYRSKLIFLTDGLFLFLESYFWMLSLYLLTQENIMQLGVLVVCLSILLALIFFVIKKRIDYMNAQRIFIISIFGYAFSWFLRGELTTQEGPVILYAGMLLIAFLSSFFRLAFNKRFYDLASRDNPVRYILCKSYYSQFMLVVFFSLIALLSSMGSDPLKQLQILYDLALPLVFVYLLYGYQKEAIKTPA